MEFLFDTANIEEIKKYSAIYPITGVTSNPSILKAEGKIDFFAHMKEIRSVIGDKSLHVQIIAEDCKGILQEAETILNKIDQQVYIKIPVTEEGLKAIRTLKKDGINVTATAIYSKIQGLAAILLEADYIAPYYNRMENQDIDSCSTISDFRHMIDESKTKTKILAASFKNIAQVNSALLAGAHTVTVSPSILHEALGHPSIKKAVRDFKKDWITMQGDVSICQL